MPGPASQTLFYRFFLLSLILISGLGFCASGKAQPAEEVPLLEIITKIQAETPFRFLYRESLVSSIRVTLDTEDDHLFERLQEQLNPYSLTVRVDSTRNQVLLVRSQDRVLENRTIEVFGQVVDHDTGERLPYATISWVEEGSIRGTAATGSGSFRLSRETASPVWQISVSHIGYETEVISLGLAMNSQIRELTVRLKPKPISGSEILITGLTFYSSKDTVLNTLVNSGKFSPLGESNAVRALQVLPSVSMGTAMNDGMNIRGSSPDGFQVLLDGMTIFNQSHLFGLLDSFNEDAIQTNNFFYDVTPAQYQAPMGGTLSLLTRTGSQNSQKFKAGLSNTSVKATGEGPIQRGRSSWLASARHSYMNTVSWFQNPDLIKWGLDIERSRSVLADDMTDLNTEIVEPGDSEARFFDLHGKVYHENRSGSRLMGSFYYGGDYTRQAAFRQARTFSSGITYEAQDVETINDWGNFVGSLQFQSNPSSRIMSHTTLGISTYETSFSKDDFMYTSTATIDGVSQASMFTYPFVNQSTLNQVKAENTLDIVFSRYATTLGASYLYYLGDYSEESFDRPGFMIRSRASQFDAFMQLDLLKTDPVTLQTGTRLYYYSAGNYLRWSPRFKLRLFPESSISLGAGFSRNHQFLHRVTLTNAVTADIWILSNQDQPPSSVNHYSAGLYLQLFNDMYFQLEAYRKDYQNLWLHEINLQAFGNTFADTPWFHENEGKGSGVEALLRYQVTSYFSITQSYTRSQMVLRNPYLNEGREFYADWDRKNRYSAMFELKPTDRFTANLSWNYASGTPNRLVGSENMGEGRLDDYNRIDMSLQYFRSLDQGDLELKVAFFNLLNHQNTWYREYNLALDNSTAIPRLATVPVDVYDLGFQPSFEVIFSF